MKRVLEGEFMLNVAGFLLLSMGLYITELFFPPWEQMKPETVVEEAPETAIFSNAESTMVQATNIFLVAESLYLMSNDEASTKAFAEIIVRYQSIYMQLCPELATPDTCHKAWELLDKYAVKHKEAALPRGVEV